MVTVICGHGAVLANFTSSSFEEITARLPLLEFTVTPPPPVAVVTVRETFCGVAHVPLVPVTVIVAAPNVAVPEAVKVRTLLVPVVVVSCWIEAGGYARGQATGGEAYRACKSAGAGDSDCACRRSRLARRLGLSDWPASEKSGAVTVKLTVVV